MKYFLIILVLIQLFGCQPSNYNDGIKTSIATYKVNDFPIRFVSNSIFGKGIHRDTFQVYYLYNNSFDTIWVKTVKESGFESLLIKKIYNSNINVKKVNEHEWLHFTSSNSYGFGSTDSVKLSPNKVILFAMQKPSRLGYDSISYDVKVTIKKNLILKDTVVNKKLRLYNKDKFVEDLEDWPSLKPR